MGSNLNRESENQPNQVENSKHIEASSQEDLARFVLNLLNTYPEHFITVDRANNFYSKFNQTSTLVTLSSETQYLLSVSDLVEANRLSEADQVTEISLAQATGRTAKVVYRLDINSGPTTESRIENIRTSLGELNMGIEFINRATIDSKLVQLSDFFAETELSADEVLAILKSARITLPGS